MNGWERSSKRERRIKRDGNALTRIKRLRARESTWRINQNDRTLREFHLRCIHIRPYRRLYDRFDVPLDSLKRKATQSKDRVKAEGVWSFDQAETQRDSKFVRLTLRSLRCLFKTSFLLRLYSFPDILLNRCYHWITDTCTFLPLKEYHVHYFSSLDNFFFFFLFLSARTNSLDRPPVAPTNLLLDHSDDFSFLSLSRISFYLPFILPSLRIRCNFNLEFHENYPPVGTV